MEPSPATLAERVGTLRASAQADSARASCLHALIMSVLARIFGRLEQMLLLWQSGELPLPQPAPPRTRHPRPRHSRTASSRRTARRRQRMARRQSPPPGLRPRTPTIQHPAQAPHRHTKPSARAVRLPPPH